MKVKARLGRNRLGGAIGAVLAILVGLGFFLFPIGQGLINRSYDLLFAVRPDIMTDEVRMIYMDEDSHRDLKQRLNATWDRSLHAKLVDYLKADHARAVVFDIVLNDPGPDPDADRRLAQAIEANGKVVLAADAVLSAIGNDAVWMKRILLPDPVFRGTNVTIGTDEVGPDEDLVIRKHVRVLPDDQVPVLSWATAEMVGAEVTRNPAAYGRERWVNYYGPPLTLPAVGYSRVFSPDGLRAGYFSNKVVFVGAHIFTRFAGERKDAYSSPYPFWQIENPGNRFVPAVEIQATMFLNLLRGDWLSRLPHERWWFVLAGAVFGFGLVQLRPMAAVGAAVLGALLVTVLAYDLFAEHHVLFAWMIVVAGQIPVALLWSVSFNSVQLYVQNRLYEQSLQMYLSPKLVKKFASERDLLKPGARKQMLTVLFSDIVDFTSISQGMDSDELAGLINNYFEAAAQCIHATDGTIVKYIGDAIFSFWNAPDVQEDHAMRACEAALQFQSKPAQFINGQALVTRLGLHTGVANVGNFGSAARVDYTAVGANINLASRIEGLNKYLRTKILISAETHQHIAGRLLTRFLGRFRLKGFESSVGIYELIGHLDRAEACRPAHEAFAGALERFLRKDFTAAEAAFRQALELNPDDGPAKFYLKTISELDVRALPENWSGAVEITDK